MLIVILMKCSLRYMHTHEKSARLSNGGLVPGTARA
jgi:hypothetical protein